MEGKDDPTQPVAAPPDSASHHGSSTLPNDVMATVGEERPKGPALDVDPQPRPDDRRRPRRLDPFTWFTLGLAAASAVVIVLSELGFFATMAR